MSKWIKKGDKVVVISGNDKTRTGEVLARVGDRVIVRGVNVRKKYRRKTKERAGSVMDMECPVHISNVSLCTEEGKAVRLRVRMVEDAKELYYIDGSKEIVHRKI